MTAPEPALLAWIPVMSSVIALSAVLVGPLITLRISRRQLATSVATAYRSVIAPMRQKWIDNLRDRVSEFMSIATWLYRKRVLTEQANVETLEAGPEWNERSIQIVLIRNQIELMLNPEEPEHNDLLALLDITRQTAVDPGRQAEFPSAVGKANARCKKILKEEWNRVKRESL